MSLSPLDLQIVIGQMDAVGSSYLRMYTHARREQFFHEADFERRSKDIDSKVLDLPEEASEYQEIDLDPHESQNKRRIKLKKLTSQKAENQEESLYHEPDKGNFIDVLR